MKVDYISDVHLDFWVKEKNPENYKLDKQINDFIDNTLFAKGGDVLILAGDTGHYYHQDSRFLLLLKEHYEHIILVHGNHDMYLVSSGQQKKYLYDSKNRILEMKRFCRETPGLHYLDGDVICIEGYKFGGAGMSWDKSFLEKLTGEVPNNESVLSQYKSVMNDARLIMGGTESYYVNLSYGGRRLITSFDPFAFFDEQMKKLQSIDENDDIDVMVSHYAPLIPPGMPAHFACDPNSTFYYFDGRKEIDRINPKYWIFGHTHDKYDFNYGSTRFLCNPLGYPAENTYTVIESILL